MPRHDPYAALQQILDAAMNQAANGKGADRHAQDQDFTDQPMQSISDLLGSEHGCLFQAMKKIQESTRLDHEPAEAELLGAINYIAGAILWKQRKRKAQITEQRDMLAATASFTPPPGFDPEA